MSIYEPEKEHFPFEFTAEECRTIMHALSLYSVAGRQLGVGDGGEEDERIQLLGLLFTSFAAPDEEEVLEPGCPGTSRPPSASRPRKGKGRSRTTISR